MRIRYKVASVGPAEKVFETVLPTGQKTNVLAKGTAVELSPDGEEYADNGTVKLVLFEKSPYEVGDTVEASFVRKSTVEAKPKTKGGNEDEEDEEGEEDSLPSPSPSSSPRVKPARTRR
jgi:hypothetical protein